MFNYFHGLLGGAMMECGKFKKVSKICHVKTTTFCVKTVCEIHRGRLYTTCRQVGTGCDKTVCQSALEKRCVSTACHIVTVWTAGKQQVL